MISTINLIRNGKKGQIFFCLGFFTFFLSVSINLAGDCEEQSRKYLDINSQRNNDALLKVQVLLTEENRSTICKLEINYAIENSRENK